MAAAAEHKVSGCGAQDVPAALFSAIAGGESVRLTSIGVAIPHLVGWGVAQVARFAFPGQSPTFMSDSDIGAPDVAGHILLAE
jgi:hypothetical protein